MSAKEATTSSWDSDLTDLRMRLDREKLRFVLVCIWVVLITVAGTSLYLSYFVFECDAWRHAYSGNKSDGFTGFVIEFGRTLIFLTGVELVLYFRFPCQIASFLGLAEQSEVTGKFRVLYAILATVFLASEYNRHVTLAPVALAKLYNSYMMHREIELANLAEAEYRDCLAELHQLNAQLEQSGLESDAVAATLRASILIRLEDKEAAIENQARPRENPSLTSVASDQNIERCTITYWWYLPYSLVNYLFIGAPLVSLWLFAFFRDVPVMATKYAEFRTLTSEDGLAFKQLNRQLLRLRSICLVHGNRYMDLLAIAPLEFAFESAVGSSTLSPSAMAPLYGMLALVGSVAICPFIFSSFYAAGIESVRIQAHACDLKELEVFERTHSLKSFWTQLFFGSVGGYLLSATGLLVLLTKDFGFGK